MVFCKVCKVDIGYLGWANHVNMHKKRVEKQIGHFPTWQEVLEFFNIVPRKTLYITHEKRHITLEDFA